MTSHIAYTSLSSDKERFEIRDVNSCNYFPRGIDIVPGYR